MTQVSRDHFEICNEQPRNRSTGPGRIIFSTIFLGRTDLAGLGYELGFGIGFVLGLALGQVSRLGLVLVRS